jgi:hypothetical protein
MPVYLYTMATARPFAYNPGPQIPGTEQLGDLSIGTPTSGITNNPPFWNGPDEDLGYVIAAPVSGNTQPTPLLDVFASLGFYRTSGFLDSDFIDLAQSVSSAYGTPQTFLSASSASVWLTNNGFWNTFIPITETPTPTPTNTPTNTVTPTNTPTTTPTPTPTSATLPTVTTNGYSNLSNGSAQISGTIVSNGGSTITQRGIVWSTSPNPTISNNVVSDGSGNPDALGQFIHTYVIPNPFIDVYVRIYATNAVGTSYGDQVSFTMPCFIKGTKITLASGLRKNIEDISYEDSLLVWNFDEGRFDSANPIWIMTPVLTQYVDILFSDGSKLGISGHLNHDGGHRIFNLDKGEFTYAIPNEHSPIGTRTFNDKGDIVTIVGKEESTEVEEIYNVVTNRHLNIFAEGILTSRRLNNLYPIEDMKFIKDERSITSIEEFKGVPVEYYEGLRLGEQPLATNSEGFLVKTPRELAYTLPTVSELEQWTVEFIKKKS